MERAKRLHFSAQQYGSINWKRIRGNMTPINGIHHITAITADAQANLDFYCGTLGLRLVKRTVNFDDPSSYHLYYGNQNGASGTILTFFAWPNAARGRVGSGETDAIALSIPRTASGFWHERLAQRNIETKSFTRFGDDVLAFRDTDNIELELVACDDERPGWHNRAIPIEYSIRGIHSATLNQTNVSRATEMLQEIMEFQFVGEEAGRLRFSMGNGRASALIDVAASDSRRGTMGAGTIHHIAFRVPDDAAQDEWRNELTRLRFGVSPVMDRTYFHSIYFREPGGVLFEIATDNPGFATDETIEALGEKLMLPPQYESSRAQIEAVLPPLHLTVEGK